MMKLRSLENQLSALRIAFDQAISSGESFVDVKFIYIQIKDLEKKISEREVELLKHGRVED